MKNKKILIGISTFILFFSIQTPSSQRHSEPNKRVLLALDKIQHDECLIEITHQALKRAGYMADTQAVFIKNTTEQDLREKYDLLLGAEYSESLVKEMAYSDPIDSFEVGLLTLKKHDIRYLNLMDLAPYSIGYLRDASVTPAFDQATFLKKVAVDSMEQNIHNLLSNKVDIIVGNKRQMLAMIKHQYPNDINQVKYLNSPLQRLYFYNAFTKTRPDYLQLRDDFNLALHEMKLDGSYSKIIQKYERVF